MKTSQAEDVIFVLNLDIGSGKKDKITFRSTDTPEELSQKFCRKNNLNIRVYDFVANALREKYDEVTLMKYIQQVSDEDRYKKRPSHKNPGLIANADGKTSEPTVDSHLIEKGNQISFGPSNFLQSSEDSIQARAVDAQPVDYGKIRIDE